MNELCLNPETKKPEEIGLEKIIETSAIPDTLIIQGAQKAILEIWAFGEAQKKHNNECQAYKDLKIVALTQYEYERLINIVNIILKILEKLQYEHHICEDKNQFTLLEHHIIDSVWSVFIPDDDSNHIKNLYKNKSLQEKKEAIQRHISQQNDIFAFLSRKQRELKEKVYEAIFSWSFSSGVSQDFVCTHFDRELNTNQQYFKDVCASKKMLSTSNIPRNQNQQIYKSMFFEMFGALANTLNYSIEALKYSNSAEEKKIIRLVILDTIHLYKNLQSRFYLETRQHQNNDTRFLNSFIPSRRELWETLETINVKTSIFRSAEIYSYIFEKSPGGIMHILSLFHNSVYEHLIKPYEFICIPIQSIIDASCWSLSQFKEMYARRLKEVQYNPEDILTKTEGESLYQAIEAEYFSPKDSPNAVKVDVNNKRKSTPLEKKPLKGGYEHLSLIELVKESSEFIDWCDCNNEKDVEKNLDKVSRDIERYDKNNHLKNFLIKLLEYVNTLENKSVGMDTFTNFKSTNYEFGVSFDHIKNFNCSNIGLNGANVVKLNLGDSNRAVFVDSKTKGKIYLYYLGSHY